MAADSSETYEKLLESSLGLSNPLNVDYLLGKLGISDTQTPSLMRGLQRYMLSLAFVIHSFLGVYSVKLFLCVHSKHFKEGDFATAIRKKQSVSWALKWFVFHYLYYI